MFDCKCNDKREDRKFHQCGSAAFMVCSTTLEASCERKIYMIHKNLTLHLIWPEIHEVLTIHPE